MHIRSKDKNFLKSFTKRKNKIIQKLKLSLEFTYTRSGIQLKINFRKDDRNQEKKWTKETNLQDLQYNDQRRA